MIWVERRLMLLRAQPGKDHIRPDCVPQNRHDRRERDWGSGLWARAKLFTAHRLEAVNEFEWWGTSTDAAYIAN
jgi:hypothetical protein